MGHIGLVGTFDSMGVTLPRSRPPRQRLLDSVRPGVRGLVLHAYLVREFVVF